MSTAIFTGSMCVFWYILNVGTPLFLPDGPVFYPGKCFVIYKGGQRFAHKNTKMQFLENKYAVW